MRRAALVLAAALAFAGVGTASATPVDRGLLPGPTPTLSFAAASPVLQTYFADCGPLVLDASGLLETPRYAAWVRRLEHAGWHQLPDGMNALYAPGC